MSSSVLVCVATYLSIKNRKVSCLTTTQTRLLQNVFSTWSPSAQKSSFLLCEQYSSEFEALKHAAVSSRGETHEDQLAQILADIKEEGQQVEDEDSEEEAQSRSIDLMVSDDQEEDEEEIGPENEEDRAFLDDEVNENDSSFYRRLNVQLDTERRQERRRTREEIADCKDLMFGEARTMTTKS